MGICPVRRRFNISILENTSEPASPGTQVQTHNSKMATAATRSGFVSAARENAVTVSLCNYPALGHMELTMRIGEQLTILSEWVTLLSLLHFLLSLWPRPVHDCCISSTATATF